jgi:hypothetical protein
MDPGSSEGKEGWWLGKQFRMQELLAIKTFNKMFRAIVPEGFKLTVPIEEVPMEFQMVCQLDWSQGHAELPKDALDGSKMLCKCGGSQEHFHHTFWVQPAGKIAMNQVATGLGSVNQVAKSVQQRTSYMATSQGFKR